MPYAYASWRGLLFMIANVIIEAPKIIDSNWSVRQLFHTLPLCAILAHLELTILMYRETTLFTTAHKI